MRALTPARPRPSPLPAAEGLTLCWYCDAAADRIDPPGWVTVGLSHEPGLTYTAGICPACLAARHGPRRPAGPPDAQPETRRWR